MILLQKANPPLNSLLQCGGTCIPISTQVLTKDAGGRRGVAPVHPGQGLQQAGGSYLQEHHYLRAGGIWGAEKQSPSDTCPPNWSGPATSLALRPPQGPSLVPTSPQRLSQNALGQSCCLKCDLSSSRREGGTTPPPPSPPSPILHKSPDSNWFRVTPEFKNPHLGLP